MATFTHSGTSLTKKGRYYYLLSEDAKAWYFNSPIIYYNTSTEDALFQSQFYSKHDPEKVLQLLQKMARLFPYNLDILTSLATSYADLSKEEEYLNTTVTCYQRALDLIPPNFDYQNHTIPSSYESNLPVLHAIHARFNAYLFLQDYINAIPLGEKLMALDPLDETYTRYDLLSCYVKLRQYERLQPVLDAHAYDTRSDLNYLRLMLNILNGADHDDCLILLMDCLRDDTYIDFLIRNFNGTNTPEEQLSHMGLDSYRNEELTAYWYDFQPLLTEPKVSAWFRKVRNP